MRRLAWAIGAIVILSQGVPKTANAQEVGGADKCKDVLVQDTTYSSYTDDEKYALLKLVNSANYDTKKTQAGGSATIPVYGIPVTFGANYSDLQTSLKTMESEVSINWTEDQAYNYLQANFSAAEIHAWSTCMADGQARFYLEPVSSVLSNSGDILTLKLIWNPGTTLGTIPKLSVSDPGQPILGSLPQPDQLKSGGSFDFPAGGYKLFYIKTDPDQGFSFLINAVTQTGSNIAASFSSPARPKTQPVPLSPTCVEHNPPSTINNFQYCTLCKAPLTVASEGSSLGNSATFLAEDCKGFAPGKNVRISVDGKFNCDHPKSYSMTLQLVKVVDGNNIVIDQKKYVTLNQPDEGSDQQITLQSITSVNTSGIITTGLRNEECITRVVGDRGAPMTFSGPAEGKVPVIVIQAQ